MCHIPQCAEISYKKLKINIAVNLAIIIIIIQLQYPIIIIIITITSRCLTGWLTCCHAQPIGSPNTYR